MDPYRALRKAVFVHPAARVYGDALLKAWNREPLEPRAAHPFINPRTRANPGADWDDVSTMRAFLDRAKTARSQVRGVIAGAQVHIALPDRNLPDVVATGAYHNSFKTGTGAGADEFSGDSFSRLRRNSEARLYGIHPAAGHEVRPVYGFLARPHDIVGGDMQTRSPGSMYGRTVLRLKPSVHARTTVAFNDSFAGMPPTPMTRPSFHALDTSELGQYHDLPGFHNISAGPYVEAQVHGGVKLSDIEHVHMENPWPEQINTNEIFHTLYHEHGITSSVGLDKDRFRTFGGK